MSTNSPRVHLIEVVVAASGPGKGGGPGGPGGAEAAAAVQSRFSDDVVDIPVGSIFFLFTDRAMYIPVVRAGLVPTGCDCVADHGDSCGARPCALQRQVPAVYEVELKVPQIRFISSLLDIPVVLQRRVPTVQTLQKTGDSAAPVQFLVGFDVPVVVQRLAPGSGQCRQLWGRQAVFVCF